MCPHCTSSRVQLAGAGGLALPGVPAEPFRLYRFAGVLRGAGLASDLFSPCCAVCTVLGKDWGEGMGEDRSATRVCVSPSTWKEETVAPSSSSPLLFFGDSVLVVLVSEITVSGSDSGSCGWGRIRVGFAG